MDHFVASGGFAGLWMPKGPREISASLPFFLAALRARFSSAFAFLSISRFRFSNVFLLCAMSLLLCSSEFPS
jgi:hypothetical protein